MYLLCVFVLLCFVFVLPFLLETTIIRFSCVPCHSLCSLALTVTKYVASG